jgi:hypothetical protein
MHNWDICEMQWNFGNAPPACSVADPIGMNLAYAFCSSAQYELARDYVLRVIEFDPDFDRAKKLLSKLNSEHPSCGP